MRDRGRPVWRHARVVAALTCALLLLATPASAQSGDHVDATGGGAPIVTGDVVAAARAGAFMLENAHVDPAAPLVVTAARADIVLTTMQIDVIEVTRGGIAHNGRSEQRTLVASDATLRFTWTPEAGPDGLDLGLHPRLPGSGRVAATATVPVDAPWPLPLDPEPFDYYFTDHSGGRGAWHYTSEPDVVKVTDVWRGADGPAAVLTGALAGFAVGGVLEVTGNGANERVVLGFHERRDDPVPGAPSRTRTDVFTYAEFILKDADATLRPAAGHNATVVLPTPRVTVAGAVTIPDATATGRAAGKDVTATRADLTATGDVTVQYLGVVRKGGADLPSGNGASYALTGDFDAVYVGGVLVAEALDVPTAVARTTIALVLAAGLWRLLRSGFAAWVAFFYTRLRPDRVLGKPERERLLRAVTAGPGAHLRALTRETGLAWGQLVYHVRVLERTKYVRTERHGRLVRVYPTTVGTATPRGASVAADRVLAAVPDGEGRTQNELKDDLGVSVQLVSHHLRALERAGVVEATEDRPKRYRKRGPGPN